MQFKIITFNLGEESKITTENERLLKRIVEITFRKKRASNGIDHIELATKPHPIKLYHHGEFMRRNLSKIKEENSSFYQKLT
jgi:Hemingway/CFA97